MNSLPLLRDIPVYPRDKHNEYWVGARFRLKDGSLLIVQHPTDRHQVYQKDRWWVGNPNGEFHEDLDEFEAQCVLDHYVQTIGIAPCNHQTSELASHPTK